VKHPPRSAQPLGWERIWRSGQIPPRYQSFAAPNETVVEWVETVAPGGFLLDVGCGVGRHMTYLGGRGFRVAGVDIALSGVSLTRAACLERQIHFEGAVAEMSQLPWADRTFDAALSTSTMNHHLRAGIIQAVAEVRRTLKPGGLFLVDFACTDTLDYQEFRRQAAEGQLTEVEPNTFVNEHPDVAELDDSFLPHHWSDEADVRDLLGSFEIIRLWPALREVESESGSGKVGKWVVWARKPLSEGSLPPT
jgi:SAM-dependent methyltransferase